MKKIIFNKEDFIKNYEELKSSRKMAEFYGCSKNTITKYAKEIGYDFSQNKEIKLKKYPVEEVYQKYLELGSSKKVAEFYNCSGTAVLNYLKENNYDTSPKTKINISEEQFIEDYNRLKSAEKVGELYGCSGTAILNYAKKIGYNPINSKEYKLSKEDKQYIINQYNSKTSNQLAEELGVSRGMITKVWFDNNLTGKEIVVTKTTEIDLSNQQFGSWTVLHKTDKRTPSGCLYWMCRCECGIEREVSSQALKQGKSQSCGCKGNFSIGNEKIRNLLKEANIPFITEAKFPTCRDINPLPFDFYIENKYLVEYDGRQHFGEHTIYDYETTHKHDLMKNQWCKDNNIPLIRIPYTHYKNLCLDDLILETSKFIVK